MKNTLLIGIEDTTVNVRLISSLDDGTNRLFVVLSADLSKHPFISINSGANIYATADEWSYEIEPTTWRGSSTFTITAGDDLNAGTTYTVSQVPSNVTTNVGLEHSSGNAYRLTYTVGSGVDTANDIVTFTSSDVADGQATAWTSVAKLESGETHASMFAKISQMFKNVRYLYKTLGNTDLSAIGNGTVTGAISWLNTNKSEVLTTKTQYGPSGALAITAGAWAQCVGSTVFTPGKWILFGRTNQKVSYLRLASFSSVSNIYVNGPYGNLIFGVYTFSTTTTAALWCYSSTNLTMAANDAGIFGIKIA